MESRGRDRSSIHCGWAEGEKTVRMDNIDSKVQNVGWKDEIRPSPSCSCHRVVNSGGRAEETGNSTI
jgi:hypothetical protein